MYSIIMSCDLMCILISTDNIFSSIFHLHHSFSCMKIPQFIYLIKSKFTFHFSSLFMCICFTTRKILLFDIFVHCIFNDFTEMLHILHFMVPQIKTETIFYIPIREFATKITEEFRVKMKPFR